MPANDGQPSKAPSSRRRPANARISAACEACKKRKTKCTGGPSPCQLCKVLGTECVIDLTLDMRRRAALQRTIDDSKTHQDNLNGLIDTMRAGPSSRLDFLLDIIRMGATNAQITEVVQNHVESTGDQDFDHEMISQEQTVASPFDDADGIDPSPNQADGAPVRGQDENDLLGGASSIASTASGSGKARDTGDSVSVSALLVTLRECVFADGETLLRRLLASPRDPSATAPLWSADSVRVSLEGGVPTAAHQSAVEDSRWHPARHARTPNSWSDAQLRVGENIAFRRHVREFVPLSDILVHRYTCRPENMVGRG